MKLLLIIFTSFNVLQSVEAQVGKGSVMLGGSLSYSSLKSTAPMSGAEYTTHEGSFTPKLGFGLSKNWILGGVIDLNGSKSASQNNDTEIKNAMFKFGIFGRKFFPINAQVGFFGEASLKYGFGKQTYRYLTNPEEKNALNEYAIAIYPGVYFKPYSKFFVEATIGNLGYTSTTTKPPDGVKGKDNEFDFTLTNNLSLGFYFILGSK